jgi:polar amino acid transport system substrate-binding protein/cystine transport system substrate-binding protein/membrane-bound lytic murein transglycosylase F
MNAKLRRDLLASLLVLTPLALIYLLPPDTSLAEARKAGALSACVPERYAPLVTGDPAKPGIEIELLRALAEALDLRLETSVEPAMARDFNPRNWRLTRAECQVIAGGIVGSDATRGFLDTTPSYVESGWALIARDAAAGIENRRVGVLTSLATLDRVDLASALRAEHAEAVIVPSAAALVAGLADKSFAVAVTERLLAQSLSLPPGWQVRPLPGPLGHVPLVLGLWKGDLTLKRALAGAFDRLDRAGTIAAIRARYGAAPLGQYRLRSNRDGSTSAEEIARSFKKVEQLYPSKWNRFAIPFDRMLL